MANAEQFDFSKRLGPKRKIEFAGILQDLQDKIGFKVSSRGWCYIMEQAGYINKDQFDRMADAINDCRRKGLLPVDFVAEEGAREFSGVELEYDGVVDDVFKWMLEDVLEGDKYYTPDWWANEEYYIQCVVEKIDVVTLFEPICKRFHIPIANSKGWSSILQRAEYARRFKEAEERGLKCVLLYCGDHDPDGLRISETLRANLEQVAEVTWGDGTPGYDPSDLIIDRFGLNFKFIQQNKFTWISNLVTGNTNKRMDLSDPKHPNHGLPYVQWYLKNVGVRKCEANVLVTLPQVAAKLMRDAIEKYIGPNAEARFQALTEERRAEYETRLEELDIKIPIERCLDKIKGK